MLEKRPRILSTHLVVVLVTDLLTSPPEVVITTEFHDVRHQIVTFDNDIFNHLKTVSFPILSKACDITHHIDHWVADFNARNRDIADILKETRQDDISNVLEQVLLELNRAVASTAQVSEQLLHGVPKSLVLGILVKLVPKELDLIKNPLRVAPITVAQQEVSAVTEPVPLPAAVFGHHIALLRQAFPAQVSNLLSFFSLGMWYT